MAVPFSEIMGAAPNVGGLRQGEVVQLTNADCSAELLIRQSGTKLATNRRDLSDQANTLIIIEEGLR